MAEKSLLGAYVEFIAKGQQSVLDAAHHVQTKLKSLDMAKAAEVKFTASGGEKIDSAVSTVKQKLAGMAHGTDFTHTLAEGVRKAIESGAEGAGVAVAAGLGSVVGGVLGATIGSQLSNIVMAIPRAVGAQIDIARENATMGQRSLTEDERKRWYEATGPGRAFWSHFNIGGKGGAEVFQEGITRMQVLGPAPKMPTTPEEQKTYNEEMRKKASEAEAVMNQSMALAAMGRIGDPVAFAEKIDKLQLTHKPRDKMSLASQDYVFERLQEKYSKYTPEDIMAAVKRKDTEKGAITSAEIVAAAVGDASNPRTQAYLKAKSQEWSMPHGKETGWALWQGEGQITLDEMEYIKRRQMGQSRDQVMKPRIDIPSFAGGMGGPPLAERSPNISTDQQTRLERLLSAESGNAAALAGMAPADIATHDLTAASIGKQYEFTSLSGLAEKMQMQAGGGGDVAEQQLLVLQSIDNKLPGQGPRDDSDHAKTVIPSSH